MTAIETALGKKRKYLEAESTYTVPLPRNDLKISIKGESVPVSFGFGGWISIKKTMDGKGDLTPKAGPAIMSVVPVESS